jgi:hypothetical protein
MRRSICQCEPKIAYAGSVKTWKFIYTSATNLPKGTNLKFGLDSEGKPTDWEIPTVGKDKSNMIWLSLPDGKTVKATPSQEEGLTTSFEFTLPVEVKSADPITFFIGSQTGEKGNACQKIIQRRRIFPLFIDTKGKKEYKDKESFIVDVRGNVLKKMRMIIPSVIARNKRFDVVIRFEDEFGNLTYNAPEDTLIELSYDHIRENLSWKLFVPETGFLTLPNLYFNEAGVYKFQLKNLQTKETFYSSPIMCQDGKDISLFWGLLHGESDRVDSTDHLEKCLRHFRDERALQFYAPTPFESEAKTTEKWKTTSSSVAEFNEDDRFTTFLSFYWEGEKKTEGLRQILFAKDNKPLLKTNDIKYNCLSKIYKLFSPKELISIPSFTMGKKSSFSFDAFNPEFERVVEIYNAWGSSENLAKEDNPRPIELLKKKTAPEASEGSIQKALANNCRFGFVAGGFDDRGIYADCFEDNKQYSAGLTGIYTKEQNRASLFEALYNRACYATTGPEIIVDFNIAESPMGTELSTNAKPGLKLNRHISGFIIGTDDLDKLELIRNGETIHTFSPDKDLPDQIHFAHDDFVDLSKICFKVKKGISPFVYYYLRATQKNGHIAWSSPIWIDLDPPKEGKSKDSK